MAIHLVEGQIFSVKYTLIQRITENNFADCWLAFDNQQKDRVCLKIFKSPIPAEKRQGIKQNIDRQKGLKHSFIVRISELDQFEGIDFVTSPYLRESTCFQQTGTIEQQWRLLRQLGKIIEFAHGVGFSHGHLHPANILVDGGGNVHLSDFGVAISRDKNAVKYLSPQVLGGELIDPRDDIYAYGQLIYRALTGRHWPEAQAEQAFKCDYSLPQDLEHLLAAMLRTSPMDRPIGMSKIIAAMDDFISKSSLESGSDKGISAQLIPNEDNPSHINYKLPREQNTVSTPIVIGGFCLLSFLAIMVFILLPKASPDAKITRPHEIQTPAAKRTESEKLPESPPLAPFEIAQLKALEKKGAELATELLRLQLELEDLGGHIWNSDQYNESLSLGISGDNAFREKTYQLALDQYQAGISLLDALLDNVDSVFTDNKRRGEQALEEGDAEVALEAFTIMKAIKPGDAAILNNLGRAESLDEVQNLVKKGAILEGNNSLDEALAFFQKAHQLDKHWSSATEGIARITQKISNEVFNKQMSLAFSALSNQSYDSAREAFQKAQKILPRSLAPKDGLEQVSIAETQAKIEHHKQLSMQHENEENWLEATKAYREILSLAQGTSFALEGLARAEERDALGKSLLKYINQAGLMLRDDALNDAKAMLIKAYKISNAGTLLKAQISQLSHLISLARIPIDVSLLSNNRTDVRINKIRSIGQIKSTTIQLYPGTYTFVGKRSGYRDIYKELTLLGGHPPPPILISCVDKI